MRDRLRRGVSTIEGLYEYPIETHKNTRSDPLYRIQELLTKFRAPATNSTQLSNIGAVKIQPKQLVTASSQRRPPQEIGRAQERHPRPENLPPRPFIRPRPPPFTRNAIGQTALSRPTAPAFSTLTSGLPQQPAQRGHQLAAPIQSVQPPHEIPTNHPPFRRPVAPRRRGDSATRTAEPGPNPTPGA